MINPNAFLGFAELCKGNFRTYAVGGGHVELMDRPELVKTVRQTIEKT